MTELLRELEAVAGLAEKASNDEPWQVDQEGDVVCNGEDVAWAITNKLDAPYIAALNNLFRTHHAEIAEALKDARRLAALNMALLEAHWKTSLSIRKRADEILQENSAREAGE